MNRKTVKQGCHSLDVFDKIYLELPRAHKEVIHLMPGLLDNPALAVEMKDFIAATIGSIPEVEAVFIHHDGHSVRVSTIVSESTRAIRRSIYPKERDLINRYESLDFAFSVFPSRGENVQSLLTEEMAISYLRPVNHDSN